MPKQNWKHYIKHLFKVNINKMKKIAGFILTIVLASCADQTGKQELESRIAEKNKELSSLKKEIKNLEQKMEKDFGSTAVDKKIPVGIQVMDYKPFNHYLQTNGETEAKEEAYISPESNGRIDKIFVEEGDHVNKGQLLAQLNTAVIRNNIEEVKTNLELADTMYKKQKKLWGQNIGSQTQYLQAKNRKESLEKRLQTLRSQLAMAQVRAPFNGTIVNIMQKEGEMGSPAARLMHLVDLSNLLIETAISEEYLSKIQKGDPAIVTFPAFPGYKKSLPVTRIGDYIDKETRTFEVEFRLKNPDYKIKPNLIAEVKINDFHNDSAFVVPAIIVKEDMKGDYLFRAVTKKNDVVAEKIYVTTGKSYNDETMIVKGLSKNDSVIIAGFNRVSNGIEVTIDQKQASRIPIGETARKPNQSR
jgi:RND family efflux transporter MFP subunit